MEGIKSNDERFENVRFLCEMATCVSKKIDIRVVHGYMVWTK